MSDTTAPIYRECDGTTERETRNCRRPAVWSVALSGEQTGDDYLACRLHLHQVSTGLLRAQRGHAWAPARIVRIEQTTHTATIPPHR